MSAYDVIVLGGDPNGLTAAAYLAKKGRKVLLLESRDTVGGLAASRAFHKGYRDAGLTWDTSEVSDAVIKDLGLDSHGLTRDTSGREIFVPDGKRGFFLRDDVARTAESLARVSETDAEAWTQFSAFLGRIKPVMNALMTDLPTGVEQLNAGDLWGLARKGMAMRRLGRKDMQELMRVNLLATRDYMLELFENPLIQGAVAAPAHQAAVDGPFAPGMNALLLLQLCARQAPLVGGAPALVTALKNAASQAGAELRTGVQVQQVRVSGGSVSGITLADGETLDAPSVLAACDPRKLAAEYLAPFAYSMKETHAIQHFRGRGVTAFVNLALNAPPAFSCREDEHPVEVRMAGDLIYQEQACDAVKYGQLAEKPVLEINIPSAKDDTCSHGDGAVMTVMSHYAPYALNDGWSDETKAQVLDRALAVMDQHTPGIRDKVVGSEVITPLDLEQDYGLVQGHLYMGEHALDQLVVRPTLRSTGYRTEINGLYLGSGGSRPGGKLTCLPGYNAARTILN